MYKDLVEVDSEKLGGTPVFYGTRVPIQNLFDCLETGETFDIGKLCRASGFEPPVICTPEELLGV